MAQAATIRRHLRAFELVKGMPAQGLECGEGRPPQRLGSAWERSQSRFRSIQHGGNLLGGGAAAAVGAVRRREIPRDTGFAGEEHAAVDWPGEACAVAGVSGQRV